MALKNTSHEWSQSCDSCKVQIDLSVTHHTKVLEGVCVWKLCAIKEKAPRCQPRVLPLI